MHIGTVNHYVTSLRLNRETNLHDLEPLKLFKKLRELYLEKTSIEDISVIEDLPHLIKLFIPKTDIVDFSPIGKLLELEELDLTETNINNLSIVNNLINLETIGISHASVKDLGPLIDLKKKGGKISWVSAFDIPALKDESQKTNIRLLGELGVDVYVS